MIINVKNWGVVSHISIDTGKPLIVMCGQNSTGKTYVSYLLYALFSRSLRFGGMLGLAEKPINEDIIAEIKASGSFEITESHILSLLHDVASRFKKFLVPDIFAISDEMAKDMFDEFSFDILLGDGEFERIISKSMTDNWGSADYRIKIDKEANSSKVKIFISTIDAGERCDLSSFKDIELLYLIIFKFLIDLAFGERGFSRMHTVERNSVYTFSKELALNRGFGKGDLLTFRSDTEQSSPERYPIAVTDSLKIAVDLQQIQKKKGYYFEYASRLEKNLLNGDIEINQNGAVEFVPVSRSDSRSHLPIQMTSSIVKTMASLIIYLKHIANYNDILIIDEPEMNLHPDNQRLLTRIFAELINKGLNIVVSTHSDYIIREINNLIMANEISEQKIRLEEGESIPYTEQQMLKRKDTEVLYFSVNSETGSVSGRKLPVTEFGFDVESIDETIISQNKVTHNLADILKYGESDE